MHSDRRERDYIMSIFYTNGWIARKSKTRRRKIIRRRRATTKSRSAADNSLLRNEICAHRNNRYLCRDGSFSRYTNIRALLGIAFIFEPSIAIWNGDRFRVMRWARTWCQICLSRSHAPTNRHTGLIEFRTERHVAGTTRMINKTIR